MARYVMVIDPDRCIGCNACTIACKVKNVTPPGSWWCKIISQESGNFPNVEVKNVPVQCMHCQNPPCVASCPAEARIKSAKGITVTDQEKCTGCGACLEACPYDVQSVIKDEPYYPEFGSTPFERRGFARFKPGVVGKCDFCQDLLEMGRKPACVEVCPLHVREFGDLDDPNDDAAKLIGQRSVYRLQAEQGTGPSVYYIGREK